MLKELTKEQVEAIKKVVNIINWQDVTENYYLSEDFIREFAGKVDWSIISKNYHLSEDFIKKFANKVDWERISAHQRLSEDFIREFANKVDWIWISRYQKLSEDFIREFASKVYWQNISAYQRLSEDFIKEFTDKVNWEWISRYQPVSKKFLKKFGYKLKNNSNKPVSYWKETVENTGLYECYDDFFFAYKGIRSDRYSCHNFQYQYLPNESYECFSDYSDDENSFGLSAWTKEKAENYCNELVIKVKVFYEDVTAVVHDGGKIRCKKLTVLN